MNALRAHDVLGADEIRRLLRPSNLQGALAVLVDWGVIAASLSLVGAYPHVLSVLLALVLIGGRQLGLAILMHEASHRTLMASRALNDWVGRWLCAGPVWADLERYRRHHLVHHTKTGTDADPDICLVEPFPTSRRGLLRKLARDVTGLTGLKRALATLAMDFEVITYTASAGARRVEHPEPGRFARGFRRIVPPLVANTALLLACAAAGKPWLFLVWAGAWLTTFSLFLRVRAIAEHACTERIDDPLRNTRTTRASWLARTLVAPHGVNYHLEHHLLMTVPFFRLPQLHQQLAARGALESAQVASGYWSVLKAAASR